MSAALFISLKLYKCRYAANVAENSAQMFIPHGFHETSVIKEVNRII